MKYVMERELLLPIKDKAFDKDRVEDEIETIKHLLPFIESFNTFFVLNDVFDVQSLKRVKKYEKVKHAFDSGINISHKYYVFSKN
ncbi:hypothetical protein [Limnovirga soli]|uniref:Uncharacterized protein n=1 Tax=Limnovirga soli TaxID=2656915 RepID=A0A8J8FH76_9BACT|nr:hypothetical protein [Limnovirga soli]NNV56572.1 hypothetical protein [Limnovirga soli]